MDNNELRKKLINSDMKLKEKVKMILANHITHGHESGALVHGNQFDSIATEIDWVYNEEFNKFLRGMNI